MEKMALPSELLCMNCSKNIAVYSCIALKTKICNLCCDRYQLSDESIDECLSCEYLLRDTSYEVKLTKDKGVLFSHQYKNKYIFDNKIENLHLKTVELYRRLGVKTIDERYNLVLQYQYADMKNEALKELDNIFKINLKKNEKAIIYEVLGNVLLSLGRVKESKDAYVKSIDYGNSTPKIYRRLGELYLSLKEYPQAIYYHNKALENYFSFEWHDSDKLFNDDFLFFTSYYSLSSAYLAIKDYQNAIINADKLIEYYGGYDKIIERYFTSLKVEGDSFIPQLIPSVYEILAVSFEALGEYEKSKQNIYIAKIFDPQNVQIGRLEGFIEGKLESNGEVSIHEEMLTKIDKINELIIRLESNKRGDFIMGNKYIINNSGEMNNLAMGDNASINIDTNMENEIKTLLYEIRDNLDDTDSNNEIDNIISNVENKEFQGVKHQLSDLLVAVSAGLITNGLSGLVAKLSEIISRISAH